MKLYRVLIPCSVRRIDVEGNDKGPVHRTELIIDVPAENETQAILITSDRLEDLVIRSERRLDHPTD